MDETPTFTSHRFGVGLGHILAIDGGYNADAIGPDDLIRAENPEFALDIVAAMCLFLSRDAETRRHSATFERFVNVTFEDFRVSYRVVDHEVIPMGSDELHTEVVAPALRLLVGSQFQKAHAAYLDAIKEIPNSPANAITDAGTALQELLTALGCGGNALGALIKSARKNGLLAGHDETLVAGITNFLNWASADRSETGDGHHVTAASRSDAWLMVHVVGALIVRLADPAKRDKP